jgi:hypothetical protein
MQSLTSLKERDQSALLELFDREDSEDIAADIANSLQWLMPEPCWEDNPFDFLMEFMEPSHGLQSTEENT